MLSKAQERHLRAIRFSPGMIVRIKLKNFVTYEDMELHAHPKLNMILGPNGTGKSTFLCAVVLGLGGKPTIIGRSPNASDYIKRDKDHAVIELELFNGDGRNHIITRKIMGNNTSNWFLQGKAVSFKKIEEILEKYNILINNLCQILPQDRVQDFAKMDRKQLLEATQKAVGKGELYEWFSKLKDFRRDLLEGGQDVNELKKKFDVESQKLKSMEDEVKSYQEKQKVHDTIASMKKKEAWLTFESKNEERLQVTNEVQELLKVYDTSKKKLKPLLNAIRKAESVEEDLTVKIQNQESVIQNINRDIKGLIRVGIQSKSAIANLKEELDAKLKSHAEKNESIEELKKKRELLAAQVPKESESSLTTGIYVADKQIEKFTRELASLRSKEGEIDYRMRHALQAVRANEQRLAQASSVIDKKIELLANFRDAYSGYKWLCENRDQFRNQIYGPMFLELNVGSPNKAKYIERIVARNDLIAFVCEDSKDMTKLLQILKEQKGLRVNAVCSPPQEISARDRFQPKIRLSHISKFGFTNYLIDLVEGPDPVLHYLCKQYNLHNIPVGTAQVDAAMDSIPNDLRTYFSSEQMYRTTLSRFSTNVAKSTAYVKEAQLLIYSVNTDLIAAIEAELNTKKEQLEEINTELAAIKEKRQQIDIESNQAKNQKREQARQLEYLKSGKVRLRMLDEELDQIEQNTVDPEVEKAQTAAKINKCIEKMIDSERRILQFMKDSGEVRNDLRLKKKEVEIAAWRVRERQKDSRQKEMEAQRAKETYEKKNDELSRLRAETRDLLQKAKQATNGLTMDDAEFVSTFKIEFQKFANTLEALRDEIGDQEALARCLQDSGNSEIVAEYEGRKKLLDSLEKTLSNITTKRSTIQQQALELREKWLPTMQKLLQTINSKFEKSFEYLGCAGTVELDLTDNVEAVENYGLNVKVKFRNEGSLQALDPFTQSGGERSLSTAIFLLSLQSVINVPFRFVDEINQGMDAFNEVRVYYLIMCAVSKEKSAQYFLITPKLLEDTKISLDTMIHVIYSGKCAENEDQNQSTSFANKRCIWSKEKYFKSIGIQV
uniref:Structural maintenance of chromosomes protein 5 n=3 Tax=Lygus hesperus TaxID=30085 RepID=A0A146MAL0_LYGHE